MVELIDNILQFIAMLLAGADAGLLFYKSHKQVWFLLACFYGTYTLGALHWALHILLFNQTPTIFYVSELAWTASYLFLLSLVYAVSTPDERKFRHPAVWLVPIFCLPNLILYLTHGEIFGNLLLFGLTTAIAWFSVRGFFYARRQNGKPRDMQFFHIAVLAVIILEYCLWTSSCFWVSDSLANPYFWFDFLLTAAMFILLPAMLKAVDA